MFATLAQVSVSIPGMDSPWFFWYVPFGIALLSLVTCFAGAIKAGKACDKKNECSGYVAMAFISGILGVATLIFSAVVFYRIFEMVLPPT